MKPSEQRQAIIALTLSVADAKASGNAKLFAWAVQEADKELLMIIPDEAPKFIPGKIEDENIG